MAKTYTQDDVNEMKELRDRLAELAERVNNLLAGDGWAETYIAYPLRMLVEKENRYDKDINDVIEHMQEKMAEGEAA